MFGCGVVAIALDRQQPGRQRIDGPGHLVEVDAVATGLRVARDRALLCEEIEADHVCLGMRVGGAEAHRAQDAGEERSEEHTSELQSLMRISYAVFCCKKN